MNTTYLFPVPISIGTVGPIPNDVIAVAKSAEYVPWYSKENYFISISKGRNVLDQYVEFFELKNQIVAAAEIYWREVICADWSINLKIRHSWLSRHYKNEFNPPHAHTTSLFTATVYLQANESCGDLIFRKDPHYLNLFPAMIDLDYHTRTPVNAKLYSVSPRDNMIIFFPSHLLHETQPNNSGADRYSLNIDFWFEGTTRKNSNGFDSIF
jgi:uncharacterized protein (TIGR02466 family)